MKNELFIGQICFIPNKTHQLWTINNGLINNYYWSIIEYELCTIDFQVDDGLTNLNALYDCIVILNVKKQSSEQKSYSICL